jgi:RND family efflux transporter MFP subunit
MMDKAIILFACIGTMLIGSCRHTPPQTSPAVPVNLLAVRRQPVVYYDRYTATTIALSQVNLLPQVQGYITGIFFKEGSHVRKGEKLYEIDRRIFEANVKNAAASLKVAEGNLQQAQQDAERYDYLYRNKAVAKQVYDHAVITLDNARNAYASAAEVLKNAETNLAYSVITAPFDGTIGFSQVKLGDLMSVGQTVLNTISTDNPMGVDFLINEKQLPSFERLYHDTRQPGDSLFTLLLSDDSLYSYPGKIDVIDRAVNPQTGTIRIRLLFPNPKGMLRAGMSCVLRVHNQETTPQVVIPNKAMVEEMGEFFVYAARDSMMEGQGKQDSSRGRAMVAIQKKVQPGVVIGPNILIKSGINDGDSIVVDGVQSLHNGSLITASDNRAGPKRGQSAAAQ